MDTLLLLQPQSRRGRPVGAAPEDRPADGTPARPPARRPRVAHHVRQEVMLAAAAVRGPAGVAARVALPALPVLPVLLLPAAALAAVVEAVDGEEGDGAEERAGEAEVVPGLGLGQVEVADDGQAEEEGEGAGALQGGNSTEKKMTEEFNKKKLPYNGSRVKLIRVILLI